MANPACLPVLVATTLLLAPAAARAQATAPSSVTPSTLRPPVQGAPPPELAEPARLAPPAGGETLKVRLADIAVEGGFPELADETAAIVAHYTGRTITLTELYEAASAIEAAHIRRGFIFARVAIPPQKLVDDGTARIVVVDGFIERVDAGAVARRARVAVVGRVGPLAGRRHLRLKDIEQPLVLTGTVPGLTLSSTLARGSTDGGAQLVLSGAQSPVSGGVSIDNGYAASLGRYAIVAQVSLNSLFGRGEQFYGLLVGGHDLSKTFSRSAPLRVLGGGGVVTTRNGRGSINPEVTFSQTQPLPQSGVPTTRGTLSRFSLRAGYVVARTRRRAIALGATLEHVEEANDAVDFATRLSLDRFTVGRVQATFSRGLAGGGGFSAFAQVSRGIEGDDLRAPSADPNAPIASRQGAHPAFTKANLAFSATRPIAGGWSSTANLKGQTSFGQPLFRSEQAVLEGADALSAYIGGATAVDAAATGRIEIAHGVAVPAPFAGIRLAPYVFGAAGIGKLERPSAIEAASYTLANLGIGVRGGLGRPRLTFTVEYAHGFSDLARFDQEDRLAGSIGFSF